MLEYWNPLPRDASVTFQVFRYPSSTPAQVLLGTATDAVEITDYVDNVSQTQNEVAISLSWHMEMYATGAQPQVDEVVRLVMNGRDLWIGIVQLVSDYGESRGSRKMRLTARSRDQSPLWREAKAVTQVYSLGTDLSALIDDVAGFLSLSSDEYRIPDVSGVYTVHTSTQLSELSAWDMFTTIAQPISYEPFVDAIGRLRFASRDVTRPPSRVLTAERLLRVGGGKAKSRTSTVRVKWLDPTLAKTMGQDQALGSATITAGFFQMVQDKDIYYSDDRTKRAEGTRLVIKQSCNTGLLPVASEEWKAKTDLHGRITLETTFWVPLLAIDSIAAMVYAATIPDGVASIGGGVTIPYGRLVHVAAEAKLMLIMMSIGTGHYEVWGTPFDYVHEVNITEAFDDTVPSWAENIQEISNDLVMNEAMAQALATRELVFLSRSAAAHSLEIIDDPSIEYGDILQLPNGARFYVTGYSRELSRSSGHAHTLTVDGFLV